jgi:hypothetical protein
MRQKSQPVSTKTLPPLAFQQGCERGDNAATKKSRSVPGNEEEQEDKHRVATDRGAPFAAKRRKGPTSITRDRDSWFSSLSASSESPFLSATPSSSSGAVVTKEWLLCRHPSSSSPPTNAGSHHPPDRVSSSLPPSPPSSEMILCDHLGSTSDMVDSLVHDAQNWSLPRGKTSMEGGEERTMDVSATTTATATTNHSKRMHQQCKQAQRQVRQALLYGNS